MCELIDLRKMVKMVNLIELCDLIWIVDLVSVKLNRILYVHLLISRNSNRKKKRGVGGL